MVCPVHLTRSGWCPRTDHWKALLKACMLYLLRFLISVVCLTVTVAWAAPCTEYQPTNNGNAIGTWHTTKAAACAELMAIRSAAAGPGQTLSVNGTEPVCKILHGTYQYTDSYNERLNPDCADTCTTTLSVSKVTNFTACYARGAGQALTDCISAPQYPTTGQPVCMNGCKWGVGDPVTAFKSETVTSTGLYRLSVDMKVAGLGQNCSEAPNPEAPQSPAATTPPCAGSLGEVNGKPFCAGTAGNPTSNDVPSNLPLPTEAGNPRAGDKPETGEGSGSGGAGRTPGTGDGGAGGGPTGAAGTGSTGPVTGGTVPKPGDGKEQANCGAPGQPQCKIDESGTPSDATGKFTDANNKLGAAMDSIKGSIEGVKDIAAPTWTWSFQLPTGCTPFPMWDGVTIDMCQYQTTIHDLMSMIWLLTTAWACIAIVGRTAGQGG